MENMVNSMTDRERKLINHIRKWEGEWANDPDDTGGCTKWGITIGCFREYYGRYMECADLKLLTENQWLNIFYKKFYNKIRAGEIQNDSVCMMVLDMCWMSGVRTAIRKIQRCLHLVDDGIVGPITLNALNTNPKQVFEDLKYMRECWYESIVMNQPKKKKFLRGWKNRLNDIKYQD